MKIFWIFLLSISLSACAHISPSSETENVREDAAANLEIKEKTPEKLPYPVSLQALMQKEITGSDLKLEQVLATNNIYTRYRISYFANGLTISGILNIPAGEGPFPLLIFNHGYIDPAIYTNGRGLKREQDYMAKQGFAVLHPDYRNHAFSEKDESTTLNFRLGYTEDVIGAILAVQNSDLPEIQVIDSENVGMLGHSMGGGIAQNIAVVQSDLVDAIVLYAPVSSDARENLERYFLRNGNRTDSVSEIYKTHGSPEANPEFWDNISPKTFFDRIIAPVQIHIGTNDDSTAPQWSYDIADQLETLGKEVDLNIYEGEHHEFGPQWTTLMKRSADFFREKLQTTTAL